MTIAARAAAATVAVLLLAPALANAASAAGYSYKRRYYWSGCKAPCTTNPPNYKRPVPVNPKPDPQRPDVLICQPGYGYVPSLPGNTGPMCVPCESGFYSPGLRSKCLSCVGAIASGTQSNAGFITPQGASSASQCVCQAGYGGPGCTVCQPGTFSAGGRLGASQNPQPACQVCPDGTQGSKKAGAISRLECGGCNPGYGGLGCKPCPAGKYSVGGDYSVCKACGPNQSSRPQSPGPEYCTCAAGYGASGSGSCTLCPLGTFWPGPAKDALNLGDALAKASSATKATLSPCLPCNDASPDGQFTTLAQGSSSVDQCICVAGYGTKLCTVCPKGTWSAGGSTADCTQCGGQGVTDIEGSTSASQCGCAAGHGGANCERCPANSYSVGGTQSTCQPCPINTESPSGSSSSEACVPKPGYGVNEDGVIAPCPVNTWSAGGLFNSVCNACPDGTVSASTSGSVKDCVCQPGYKPAAVGCVQCGVGEVCGGGSSGGVIACPAGSVSPAGSDSIASCICQAGYGGADCQLCPQGFYSAGGSRLGCKACPLGMTSPAGSDSVDDCVCLPGRGGLVCAECPAGTYSLGLTTLPCASCPQGSTTVATGSDNPSDCVCQPGYGGPFCSKCAAGELCPGGTRLSPVVCPANSFAPDGATTVQQCVCKAGYGRVAGSDGCTACPIGTYSEGNSTDSCTPCGRTETTATVASTSIGACVCKPGFGGAFCTQCPANTYSTGFTVGLTDCVACPVNSKSAPGSTSSTDCVCAAGYGGPACAACSAGTYSTGGSVAAPNAPCTRCGNSGSGYTTSPLSAATSDAACVCKPGYGGANCASCPANTYGAGGDTDDCLACPAGTVSDPNSRNPVDCKRSVCPAGQQLSSAGPLFTEQVTCVCKPGYGSGSPSTPCSICAAGTYSSGGAYDACKPCGFGLTGPEGATSKDQCVESKVRCPVGMYAAPGAVSAAECSCLPGYGATGKGSCAICPAGTYSLGLTATDSCQPCAFGYTSPVGSSGPGACYALSNACPAGMWTNGKNASTTAECVCQPGYGAGLTGEGCFQCPVGTWSDGTGREACQACPFGTTSAIGSKSLAACVKVTTACPVGMAAPLDAASAAQCTCMAGYGTVGGSKDSCALCPVGTFSAGGALDPCTPCGFGNTSPAGSIDISFCYATNQCPPGTFTLASASSAQECVCKPGFGANALATLCTLCPAGTYSSPNNGMEECRPCPFGTFSEAGAFKVEECKLVAQECPVGQVAPIDAVSAAECGCMAGFGVADIANPTKGCAVCPAGTYSPGMDLQACIPCGFGLTSPIFSDDATDCYPLSLTCPPGMDIPDGSTASTVNECMCKPGYGGAAVERPSTVCTLCPTGTFSVGGSREQCVPCPFGTTSAPGSTNQSACIVSDVTCPAGQINDAGSLECHCRAGFGWADGSCQICPVGTWGDGIGIQPCMPCGFGMTSPIGSDSPLNCYPVNQCPVGMWVDPNSISNPASSDAECTCKPGYGGNTDGSACFMCTFGTWNDGKNGREPCQTCGFGFTGPEGLTDGGQCQRVSQECPNGQGPNGEPSQGTINPMSAAICACLPGYGDGSISSACSLCPAGTFSRGGTWQPCEQCPAGLTSLPGARDIADCLPNVNMCPPGMTVAPGSTNQASQCVCQSGYGAYYSGNTVVACVQCAAGTYSVGGNLDQCLSCPVGFSSPTGANNVTQCTLCPTGTYGPNGICNACPIGYTTVPGYGAASSADCGLCKPGFGVTTGACKICPAGTYSAGGIGACQSCPIGMSSEEGSVLSSQCFCNTDGYGIVGNNTAACIKCPKGTYSSQVRGLNTCVSCPAGMTTTDSGKSSPTACICDAGYGSWPNTTASCQPCITPYYQGSLDNFGVPTTTATEAKPFPECVLCTGAKQSILLGQTSTITEVTGDANMLCTTSTTRPSAYCASWPAPPTNPPCGNSRIVYDFDKSGNITLPEGVLTIAFKVWGAAGSAGRSLWAVGINQTAANAGGLGGYIEAEFTGTPALELSSKTLHVLVGSPGAAPPAGALAYGGGGGGFSAVLTGNANPANNDTRWLVSAGGGGGGGASTFGITGFVGGHACTLAVVTAPPATAAAGGSSIDPTANGSPGTGPVSQTGNGGRGSANNGNTTMGSAGGGGGGGFGLAAGAGGLSTVVGNSFFSGMAGGAPGGGGGGGCGSGPASAGILNYGLSPAGGGGGGFVGGIGGDNNPAGTGAGRGGFGGVCQVDQQVAAVAAVRQSDKADGTGFVSIIVVTNTPVYP